MGKHHRPHSCAVHPLLHNGVIVCFAVFQKFVADGGSLRAAGPVSRPEPVAFLVAVQHVRLLAETHGLFCPRSNRPLIRKACRVVDCGKLYAGAAGKVANHHRSFLAGDRGVGPEGAVFIAGGHACFVGPVHITVGPVGGAHVGKASPKVVLLQFTLRKNGLGQHGDKGSPCQGRLRGKFISARPRHNSLIGERHNSLIVPGAGGYIAEPGGMSSQGQACQQKKGAQRQSKRFLSHKNLLNPSGISLHNITSFDEKVHCLGRNTEILSGFPFFIAFFLVFL